MEMNIMMIETTQDHSTQPNNTTLNARRNDEVEHLLDLLKSEQPLVRQTAARQFQLIKAPTRETIKKLESELSNATQPDIKSTLEDGLKAMRKSAQLLWLKPGLIETLHYPNLCASCGTVKPQEKGTVAKSSSKQKVRFVWEQADFITLEVPVCQRCKRTLDRHTSRASKVSIFAALAACALLLYMTANLLYLVIFLPWAWALGSRLGRKFYTLYSNQIGETIWQELCAYDGETLKFTHDVFQKKLVTMNANR